MISRKTTRKTAQLGDIVAEMFDHATSYSPDPKVVARLATHAVMQMVRRSGRSRTVDTARLS